MQWSPCLRFIRQLVGNLGSRRGYSLYWPIRGGSVRKGYLFQASGIRKGREICHLGLLKGPKGLTDEFYGFIKSRKRSSFVIDSHSNGSAFTAVKMQSSKQGM